MHNMETLIDHLVSLLMKSEGPVAIHGGHFQVEVDPKSGLVYPAVPEELIRAQAPARLIASVQERVGIFPHTTFVVATKLAVRLRSMGREVKIVTLVNDLTNSMRHSEQGADAARKTFYHEHRGTLGVYEQILDEHGLDPKKILTGLKGKQALISETWLRRTPFKARLKNGTRAGAELHKTEDGSLELEDLGCPILSQGQAGCAGEVCELHMQAQEYGFHTLVNFYPLVCKGYVEKSLEIADRLWGLNTYQSIEIALPATGEQTLAELFRDMHIHMAP